MIPPAHDVFCPAEEGLPSRPAAPSVNDAESLIRKTILYNEEAVRKTGTGEGMEIVAAGGAMAFGCPGYRKRIHVEAKMA
jgi:hypothetical protein